MEFFPAVEGLHLSGSTLILPAVSIGNVGQLAIETILCTLSAPLVGYLYDDNVLPCAGYDPLGTDPSRIALSLELYKLDTQDIYILQQRAPVIAGRKRAFSEHLIDWAKSQGCSRVVIVGSLDAGRRRDTQITDRKARFVGTDKELGARLLALGLVELEDGELFDVPEKDRKVGPWPIVHKCRVENLAVCSVLVFANEGNNVQDALVVGRVLSDLLEMGTSDTVWKLPPMLEKETIG